MSISAELVAELRGHFTGDIRLDPASRLLYSTDASIYQIEPLGVVIPRNQDDLQAAVELAARWKLPILPRGSGTSLAGQAIGPALILDCSRWLDRIVDIDPTARTATVEPGVILGTLNRAAARHGLQFGPDPASAERATMGGVIANNATGAHSIAYGMTADHLLAAQVILSDGSLAEWRNDLPIPPAGSPPAAGRQGEIVRAALEIREKYAASIRRDFPATWRNSAGYRLNYLLPWSHTRPKNWAEQNYPPVRPGAIDLAALLAGSEGTLAVIRQATLGLVPKPAHTALGILSYESVAAACDAVPGLLERGPSAVELIPRMLIEMARTIPAYARQLDWVRGAPEALLAVEFSGDDPAAVAGRARGLGPEVVVAESPEDQARVWSVRKAGLGLFDSRPAAARPIAFIEDCAIPVDRLGEYVREVERILSEHGTTAAFYAHASAGCLHIRPILDLRSGAGVRALRSIAGQTLALVLRLGGAMASEHGDGLARGEWLRQTYGAEVCEALVQLKQAADPGHLLNPGKLLDAPPMDTQLRYGESYRTRTWIPALDFSRRNGLAAAIEQCNGQGVCRKFEGTMCPSFQATRDEMHSTRGRANLLRALISGGGTFEALSESTFEALDLCLACKGCTAECPSGVDMPRLKSEFQHEYYRKHRRRLRDYFFAYIDVFAKMGAPLGGLINSVLSNSRIRALAAGTLGLAEGRPLPRFAPKPLPARPGRYARTDGTMGRESVLLLTDTFTHFFEPGVESAAVRVLAACGVDVRLLKIRGAGRPALSKGFIEAARRHATGVVDEIRRLDPQGHIPVVGLEPSELYMLRDEYLDLIPERRAEITALATRVWLIDEYLIREGPPEREKRILRVTTKLGLRNQSDHTKALLHGHCHQKAQPPAADNRPLGVAATAELLRLCGYEVETIASGCCGMAGAFGYESEHYDLSLAVGELTLLPAVRRAAAGGAVNIVAAGTSCRSQILDGGGVRAVHPVELIAGLLES